MAMGQAVNLRYESSNPSLGAIGINIMNCEKCNAPLKRSGNRNTVFICNCKPAGTFSECSGYFIIVKEIENDLFIYSIQICFLSKNVIYVYNDFGLKIKFINDTEYIKNIYLRLSDNMIFC